MTPAQASVMRVDGDLLAEVVAPAEVLDDPVRDDLVDVVDVRRLAAEQLDVMRSDTQGRDLIDAQKVDDQSMNVRSEKRGLIPDVTQRGVFSGR